MSIYHINKLQTTDSVYWFSSVQIIVTTKTFIKFKKTLISSLMTLAPTCFAFGSWFVLWVVAGRVDQICKLLDQRTQTVVNLFHFWH